MKKIAIIALLALAGCMEEPAVEKARIEKSLPPGCTMTDLGSYQEIDRVLVVTCDGVMTETTIGVHRYQSGKVTHVNTFASVVIGGVL